MIRDIDRSGAIIILVMLVWLALGILLGSGGDFVPQCDDVRPRGC